MAALHQKPKEVLLVPQPSALSEAEKQLAKELRGLVRSAHHLRSWLVERTNEVWNLLFYARVVRHHGPGERPEELENLKGRYPFPGGGF